MYDISHFSPDRFLTGVATWSNPFTAGERSDTVGATIPPGSA